MKKEKPALIYLELTLFTVNGWDSLSFMRNENMEIHVIILTSSSSQQDRDKAMLFHNVYSFQLNPLTKTGFTDLLDGALKTGNLGKSESDLIPEQKI